MQTWLLPHASVLARSLGWALLHSLWQGLAIYAALRLLLLFIKGADARIKYGISVLALGGVFGWFLYDWLTSYQHLQVISTQLANISTTSVPLYATAVQADVYHKLLSGLEGYMPLLVSLYVAGLVCMLLRFTINIIQVKRLRSNGLVVPDASLQAIVLQLQNDIGLTKRVQLFLSKKIYTPILTGVLRPVILLPIATVTQLNTAQLEAILLHELAHIKRHDYLLNILQSVVETILFFNPFIWSISAAIRKEREHCCDDVVLAHTPQALCYAQALAQLATYQQANAQLSLAATGHKNQLFHRIKRIMEMKKENIHYGRLGIALMLIVAIVVSAAWFTPALAQKAKKDDKKAITKTVIKQEEKYVFIDSNGHKREYTSLDDVPQADKEKLADGGDGKGTKNITIQKSYTIDDADTDVDMTEFSEQLGATIANATQSAVTTGLQQAGNAMKAVDWNEINEAINSAQKEVSEIDWSSIRKDINESMERINDSNMRKKILVQVQKSLDKNKKAMANASIQMNRSMQIAANNMVRDASVRASRNIEERALSNQNGSYEAMLHKMDNDGLIDRADGFKIEKKGTELYINGKRQSEDVYQRYSRYLNGKKVTIKGDDDNLSINIHQ